MLICSTVSMWSSQRSLFFLIKKVVFYYFQAQHVFWTCWDFALSCSNSYKNYDRTVITNFCPIKSSPTVMLVWIMCHIAKGRIWVSIRTRITTHILAGATKRTHKSWNQNLLITRIFFFIGPNINSWAFHSPLFAWILNQRFSRGDWNHLFLLQPCVALPCLSSQNKNSKCF